MARLTLGRRGSEDFGASSFETQKQCRCTMQYRTVCIRLPKSSNKAKPVPRKRQRNNLVRFDIDEDQTVREKLEAAMERDPHALISIDILLHPRKNRANDEELVLLERWGIKYDVHAAGALKKATASWENVKKNILILIRSVYSYAKILPAAQLCSVYDGVSVDVVGFPFPMALSLRADIERGESEERAFEISYKISTTSELIPFGSPPRNFLFAPIETSDGKRLQIWVSHREKCSYFDFARAKRPKSINHPRIIKDYIINSDMINGTAAAATPRNPSQSPSHFASSSSSDTKRRQSPSSRHSHNTTSSPPPPSSSSKPPPPPTAPNTKAPPPPSAVRKHSRRSNGMILWPFYLGP
eukprot:jgi/Bigna1/84357/fgenesh1_pg.131_\